MKKNNFLNILFSISTFIILLVFFTNLLCVLGWLVKIPITAFHLPIAFLLTAYINYLLNKRYKKINKKDYLITISGMIFIFVIALIVARSFWDVSYDGAWYHSIAFLRLSDGWNPIYELINSGQFGDVFIDSYSNKSIWSFAAAVYSLLRNINAAKVLSTLLAFSVTFLSISIFGKYAKDKFTFFLIIIISSLIAFNPIYMSQVFSNYIDSSLGLYSIYYLLLFISYYLEQVDFDNLLFDFLIISCIALMINTKLTGLFLSAIFFSLFIIPKFCSKIIHRNFKTEWFKQMFLTGFFGLVFALLIGINPFITNIIRGHNIFYPILGSERIEVMGDNVPEAIRNKTNLEKIIIVNNSRTSNSVEFLETKYQNPLNIDVESYMNISFDTRVGSFGNMFITIMYLSIISFVVFFKYILKKNEDIKKIKNSIFLAILYIIITALLFSESWWGRYYPILYIIPALLAFYYILTNNKYMKYCGIIIIILMTVNISLICSNVLAREKEKSEPIMNFIENNKNKKVIFWCYDPTKKWDYAYMRYFKQNSIEAQVAEREFDNADFIGYNIEIKFID